MTATTNDLTDDPTIELPAESAPAAPAAAAPPPPPLPALDEEWLQTGPPKGIRVRASVAALVLLAVLCIGMAAGARLARDQTPTTVPGGARTGAVAGATGPTRTG